MSRRNFNPELNPSAGSIVANIQITSVAPSTPAANTVYRDSIVRGWCHLSGATWTIDDDFNVTSITDNNPGDFTITWETDFNSATYVVAGAAIAAIAGNALGIVEVTDTAKSAAVVRIAVINTTTGGETDANVSVVAIGD